MENDHNTPTSEVQFLTVAQAARYMKQSDDFVRLLCNGGQLPGALQEYERGPWRIPTKAVDTWISLHQPSQTITQKIIALPLWSKIFAIITVLAVISGFIADSFGAFVVVIEVFATATPTSTSTPTSTITPSLTTTPTPSVTPENTPIPSPTVTPLAVATAFSGEVLILLADFLDQSEHVNYDAAIRIEEEIRDELEKQSLSNVRLERLNKSYELNQLEDIMEDGATYNASIVIWGYYDDAGMFPRFTVVDPDKLDIVPQNPQSQNVNLANPPDDFTLYINSTLPTQLAYLTQFVVGQIFLFQQNYSDALRLFDNSIRIIETNQIDASESQAALYYYRGYIYQSVEYNFDQAIFNYTKSIELNPTPSAYHNRGAAYFQNGDIQRASQDYREVTQLDGNYADNMKTKVSLEGANFTKTSFVSTTLSGANLRNAIFISAEFKDSDLSFANLRGADFSEANLRNTILVGAKYSFQTIWPDGFDPTEAGAILDKSIIELDPQKCVILSLAIEATLEFGNAMKDTSDPSLRTSITQRLVELNRSLGISATYPIDPAASDANGNQVIGEFFDSIKNQISTINEEYHGTFHMGSYGLISVLGGPSAGIEEAAKVSGFPLPDHTTPEAWYKWLTRQYDLCQETLTK